MLTTLVALAVAPQALVFTVHVDKRMPVSPYVYGANFPDWDKLKTPFTLARQGGNRMSAYNWENNASNAGSDWKHQSDGYMGETDEPGWTQRSFMEAAHERGAAVVLTIPTLGLVSADKAPEGDVADTPNYLETRFHRSMARKPGGDYRYPPDLSDKFVYQDEFVHWIMRRKASGAKLWFSLDNEPDLWAHTHARLVPKPLGYAEIIANNVEFASGIKRVAPSALIFGPANYGWQGFRTFQDAPDAAGRDFLNVYLAAMRDEHRKRGLRLLDVLDIHWYPEARGADVRIASSDGSKEAEATHEARIQASRSLWDPKYVEDSWIARNLKGEPIRLLPRVLAQIRQHYPGTKLAITEYDFGGGRTASGLVAQADVLGLFGRHGVFAACHWGIEPSDPSQIAAFRAYLDYDGKGSRVGDTGLAVAGTEAAKNALYAFEGPKKALTFVAINKEKRARFARIRVPGLRSGKATAFLADPNSPMKPRQVSAERRGDSIHLSMPPRSVITVALTR